MEKIELGDRVRDIVSGIVGIAVSEIKYLSGCHQYGVQSKYESGKMPSAEYIDAGQLIVFKKRAAIIVEEAFKEDPGGAQAYAPHK